MVVSSRSKRAAILEAARQLFIKHGYSGTSMDAIAEAAPVSKPTLYNHFQGKSDLFAAVITDRCQDLLSVVNRVQTDDSDAHAGLTAIAAAFVELLYSEDALVLYRLIIAEQQYFPELGETLYRSGPQPVLETLSSYLDTLKSNHILFIEDTQMGSRIFISLLKGDEHFRCLLGLQHGLSDQEKQNLIKRAVGVFLKGYCHAP